MDNSLTLSATDFSFLLNNSNSFGEHRTTVITYYRCYRLVRSLGVNSNTVVLCGIIDDLSHTCTRDSDYIFKIFNIYHIMFYTFIKTLFFSNFKLFFQLHYLVITLKYFF